ncbi:hypothetical protein P0O24_12330, partial [Methanotrichaceae archaeon M04Ac]
MSPLSREEILGIYDRGPEAVIDLVESLYAIIILQEKRIAELEERVRSLHGSSVKEFKLHNISIFHTNYALSRFDPISRLTCCSLFDQANL